MSGLPYRWTPLGATPRFGVPEVGALIGFQHTVYRVIEVRERPEHGDVVLQAKPVCPAGGEVRHLGFNPSTVMWQQYRSEHFPICGSCLEPLPCREETARKLAREAAERMARYEMPGVCPACSEVVTERQESRTFPENFEVPLGPPVTFHTRQACAGALHRYAKRWAEAYPPSEETEHSEDRNL